MTERDQNHQIEALYDLRVILVGPLPPPVHGFAVMNQLMLEHFKASFREVIACNTSPAVKGGTLGYIFRTIFSIGSSVRAHRSRVYLGLSGGLRQAIDAMFIAIARVRRIPIVIHHHSFAYVNQRKELTAFVFALSGNATHVALCESMRSLLIENYRISPERIKVLSNAALVFRRKIISSPEATLMNNSRGVRIGFLSNITAAKGIFFFLEAIKRAKKAGLITSAKIAGPVERSIEEEFQKAIDSLDFAQHVGFVDEDGKASFFRSIDILVFPSTYANEAEPVTILEAFAHGVPVIATNRGCIPSMMSQSAGAIVDNSDIAAGIVDGIRLIAQDLPTYAAGALARYNSLLVASNSDLRSFTNNI